MTKWYTGNLSSIQLCIPLYVNLFGPVRLPAELIKWWYKLNTNCEEEDKVTSYFIGASLSEPHISEYNTDFRCPVCRVASFYL